MKHKTKTMTFNGNTYSFDFTGFYDDKGEEIYVNDLIRFADGQLFEVKRELAIFMQGELPIPYYNYVLFNCLGETIIMDDHTVVKSGGLIVGDMLNDFHLAAEYSKEKKPTDE